MKNLLKSIFRFAGYEVMNLRNPGATALFPKDFSEEEIATCLKVRPYTQTPSEAVVALIHSVEYLVSHKVLGAIVECGVWKGGSMMAVANTLIRLQSVDRELYLFDTFEGMPRPSSSDGTHDLSEWQRQQKETHNDWNFASLEEVKNNLLRTDYDPRKLHFIKGKVEDTIPGQAPPTIALLRLDTDFYESTRHELTHLLPRLSPGGIVIIDDYGAFQGARKAVDEYLREMSLPLLLHRVNADVRIGVKR